MAFEELRRLNEQLKRLNEMMRMIRTLQELRKHLEKIKDIQDQNKMIREFIEEQKKDLFWRGEKPSADELENLREQAGYDKEMWSSIVRELLGEPTPPKSN
jgi:hypothetical protein